MTAPARFTPRLADSADEALHRAAKALNIAAYEFAAAAARKGGTAIAREDIHAVMRVTDEWVAMTEPQENA